jgi:hypothetical protein
MSIPDETVPSLIIKNGYCIKGHRNGFFKKYVKAGKVKAPCS